MRNKLKESEKKQSLTVRLNPIVMGMLNQSQSNKSKYIEYLIYKDMRNNNIIEKDLML